MTRPKPWRMNDQSRPLTIAGVPVRRDMVEWLVWTVEEPTAHKLKKALANGTLMLALEDADEDRILCTLEDPPEGLAELRGVLARSRRFTQPGREDAEHLRRGVAGV